MLEEAGAEEGARLALTERSAWSPNWTPTVFTADMVTVHVGALPLHAPVQPRKMDPD